MTQRDVLVSGMACAIRAHEPLPEVNEQLELGEAYHLQHKVTALRTGDIPGGIKLGVTNPAAQSFFGLDHALLGSLYGDSRLESGATIPFLEGRGLETEFAVLVDESLSSGTHTVTFDASSLSSGVYLYRLQSNAYTQTRKLLILR